MIITITTVVIILVFVILVLVYTFRDKSKDQVKSKSLQEGISSDKPETQSGVIFEKEGDVLTSEISEHEESDEDFLDIFIKRPTRRFIRRHFPFCFTFCQLLFTNFDIQ